MEQGLRSIRLRSAKCEKMTANRLSIHAASSGGGQGVTCSVCERGTKVRQIETNGESLPLRTAPPNKIMNGVAQRMINAD